MGSNETEKAFSLVVPNLKNIIIEFGINRTIIEVSRDELNAIQGIKSDNPNKIDSGDDNTLNNSTVTNKLAEDGEDDSYSPLLQKTFNFE